MNAINVPFSST